MDSIVEELGLNILTYTRRDIGAQMHISDLLMATKKEATYYDPSLMEQVRHTVCSYFERDLQTVSFPANWWDAVLLALPIWTRKFLPKPSFVKVETTAIYDGVLPNEYTSYHVGISKPLSWKL